MKKIEIRIKTHNGETIELTAIEKYLTRLAKKAEKRDPVRPELNTASEKADLALQCYINSLTNLTIRDLQLLWYAKNMPLSSTALNMVRWFLSEKFEAESALQNFDDTKIYSPFSRDWEL